MRRAFTDHGLDFSADTLKQALSLPFLGEGLNLGEFLLVDYGYDAAQWESSRERIVQQLALSDKTLYSECLLSRQLRVTMRNVNICHGRMPIAGSLRPEDTKCIDRTKSAVANSN
jgi:hypothetical protein